MKSQKERIKNQFIHSQNRFRQRYGGELTKEQYDDLISDVQNGLCQPIAKVSNIISIFKSGEWIFVYSKNTHTIMTFLTEDMIDHYLEKEKHRDVRVKTGNKGKLTPEQCDDIYSEMISKFS